MGDGKILYAKSDKQYFIKLTGYLRFDVGRELDNLINIIFDDPELEDVMIDMTEAEYFDSTILGLLAKVANKMYEMYNRKVTLLSTNKNINFLLDNIGLSEVFIIVDNCNCSPESLKAVPNVSSSEVEQALTILDAHRRLMALNEQNKTEFKDVVELLEKASEDQP
jgi:anti-anti-sigma factor